MAGGAGEIDLSEIPTKSEAADLTNLLPSLQSQSGDADRWKASPVVQGLPDVQLLDERKTHQRVAAFMEEGDPLPEDPKPANDRKPPEKGLIDWRKIEALGLRDLSQIERDNVPIGKKEFFLQKYRGNPEKFTDSTGSWECKDGTGKNWQHTDNPKIKWKGTVEVTDKNEWVRTDQTTGVIDTYRPNGVHIRESKTANVVIDENGVPVSFKDPKGKVWLSENGKDWIDTKSDATRRGTPSIDKDGNFSFKQEREPAKPPVKGDSGTDKRPRDDRATPETKETKEEKEKEGRKEKVERAKPKDDPEELARLKNELKSEFGVKIAEAGASRSCYGHRFTATEPTVEELKAAQAALRKSEHSNTNGIKLWFMDKSQPVPKEMASTGAVYHSSGIGSPEIVLLPSAREKANGWNGLEGFILHEMVHHEQYERKLFDFGKNSDSTESKQLASQMGWVKTARDGYVLLDKEGRQWKHDSSGKWALTKGTLGEGESGLISSAEMREKALVKPATRYFTSPVEMHAEAVALYRYNPAHMKKIVPELFAVTEKDQRKAAERSAKTRR